MRNLKKILALVLALVMSLSLMATAGAGSFQDVTDDNPYKTAIDVLDQLKVFQGFEDGSFKPTSNLNRAQAAVLVYRIATGDVEGKYVDNYTYMAQSKFNDLDGYTWAKGYINYCQNAKIVVGTSDTTFNPGGNVTGYQLMVMVLRTLGYGAAGEFADPTKWELETAKIAEREGILKNVTGGDFGAPAQRQMVAEILFRGLLTETVDYSALTPGGYTKTGETLGKRELGLEEIKGVVVANEYADLRDDDTLADGKTAMDVDGETYTLDKGTTLDDIGEARLAYIQNGSTVLYLADAGNTTEESTDTEKVDAILSRAGISKGSADEYINFGKGFNWKSPWKIKYVIDLGAFADEDAAKAGAPDAIKQAGKDGFIVPDEYYTTKWINGYDFEGVKVEDVDGTIKTEKHLTYTATFAIKVDITAEHQSNIKKIFNIADKKDSYITGEVYAGTTSKEDLSDKITLDDFIEEYITADAMDPVSKNENGNWVKVIDNNGDGKADYIFKVIYTVAQVSTAKDGKYTLDTKNRTLTVETTNKPCGIDDLNNLTGQKVVSADELNVDDVVYYAIIDGKAQTYLAEVVPGVTIEKYVRKTETVTTSDGTDYIKSGVCEHIEDEAYMSNPELLAGKVSYDLFLDRGGHLAAFVKSDKASDYKLITDGWFNSTKTADEYAVRVYDEESERADKQEIVDLTANGSLFIDRDVVNNDHTVDNNDWGALKYLGGTSANRIDESARNDFIAHTTHGTAPAPLSVPGAALNGGDWTCTGANTHKWNNEIKTTVAAITADGTILPVENSSVTGRYNHAMIDLPDLSTVPTKAAVNGVIYFTNRSASTDTAYDTEGSSNVTVRALDNTIYYVVYPAATASGVAVEKSVGYANAPGVKAWNEKGYVEDIYAVGTARKADNDIDDTPSEYTADIVVIELNYYEDSKETILVLDDLTKLSDVRYRELLVINGKGEQEIRKIDWLNNTRGYEDSIVNSKKVVPGLYYMTETSTDGIYRIMENGMGRIACLTANDIAKDGTFAAGWVERVNWTGDNKYVVMDNHEYNTYWDGVKAAEGQYDLTAETPLFRVEYDSGVYFNNNGDLVWAEYGDAELTGLEDGEDHTTVLASQVDIEDYDFAYPEMRDTHEGTGHNLHYYNYNRVLVHHNGDGAAVYAVSFANVYDDAEGEYNMGQAVWNNVMPAPASKGNTLTVVEKDGDVASEDITIDFGDDTFNGSFQTKDKSVQITITAPFGCKFAAGSENIKVNAGAELWNKQKMDNRTFKVTINNITKDTTIFVDLEEDTSVTYPVSVKETADPANLKADPATIAYNTNVVGQAITVKKANDANLSGTESIVLGDVKYGSTVLTKGTNYTVSTDVNGNPVITLASVPNGDTKIKAPIEIAAELETRTTWEAVVSLEGGQLKDASALDLTLVSAVANGEELTAKAETATSKTYDVPMNEDLVVTFMVNSNTALHAYGDVGQVESSDLGTVKQIVVITVPYVAAVSEQAVTIADHADYESADDEPANALTNVPGDLSSAAKTLDEALAAQGADATITVKGEVTEASFGDAESIEIISEDEGTYIIKATAEDKSVAYYVIAVEAAPSDPVGEGNPLGTDINNDDILFTNVSEADSDTGAVTYTGKVKAGATATGANEYAFDVEVDAQYKVESGEGYTAEEKAVSGLALAVTPETKTWTITVTAENTAQGAAIAADIDFALVVVPREFVEVKMPDGDSTGVTVSDGEKTEWTGSSDQTNNGVTFKFSVPTDLAKQTEGAGNYKGQFTFVLTDGFTATLTSATGWSLDADGVTLKYDHTDALSGTNDAVELTITVKKTVS